MLIKNIQKNNLVKVKRPEIEVEIHSIKLLLNNYHLSGM